MPPFLMRSRHNSFSSADLVSNSVGVTVNALSIAVCQYFSSAICSNCSMTRSGLVNS